MRVRNQRLQTTCNLEMAWLEERFEAAVRFVGRKMGKRERARHLYDEWKQRSNGCNSLEGKIGNGIRR